MGTQIRAYAKPAYRLRVSTKSSGWTPEAAYTLGKDHGIKDRQGGSVNHFSTRFADRSISTVCVGFGRVRLVAQEEKVIMDAARRLEKKTEDGAGRLTETDE